MVTKREATRNKYQTFIELSGGFNRVIQDYCARSSGQPPECALKQVLEALAYVSCGCCQVLQRSGDARQLPELIKDFQSMMLGASAMNKLRAGFTRGRN